MKLEKQTVGEILREARKEKGLTLEEISRETNIPKRYLEALEEDNFTVFASETYAMGFLSNFAEVLELDKDLLIAQFKRQKKIEEDSPIEALVGNKTSDIKKFIVPAVAGVLTVLIILMTIIIARNRSPKSGLPRKFEFSAEELQKISDVKFKIKDTLLLSKGNRIITIVFADLDKANNLTLKIDDNPYTVKGSGILTIDSDYDGTNDMNIEILSIKQNSIKINIVPVTPGEMLLMANSSEISKIAKSIISEKEWYVGELKKETVIKVFSSASCWIAYKADDKDEKNVYMKENGQEIILFNNILTLYYANAGAIKLSIENKEEALGGGGEVGKCIFYWKKKGKDFALVQALLR